METKKTLLRVNDLSQIFGVSKSCIFRWIKNGRLPQPVKLGARMTCWHVNVINEILEKLENRGQLEVS
ncbi:MAG: AlpA family phage regulatory protein [Desulfovibrionaceae bacterium]|nr:AlpA family phage regulatory protein [Desulfovibrionaceae bacterium]